MSSAWSPLPRGGFSGIDWSRPGAIDGFDPYLVWAEADRFAGHGGPPTWLQLAVELPPGVDLQRFADAGHPAWLRVPPGYRAFAPAGLRFCTARVRPPFFAALQPGGALHGLVRRFELGLAVEAPGEAEDTGASDAADARGGAGTPRVATTPPPLQGKVLAFIDDSLAVAHTRLLDPAGAPRAAFLWRQDGRGPGRPPGEIGYGRELRAAEIQAAMQACRPGGLLDEEAVYVALGLSALGRSWPRGRAPFHALDLSTSHGTHVADLAAGPCTLQARTANLPPDLDAPPGWEPADDEASRCPLIGVQLDVETVADTSGGSMNVAVLDGLLYILSRCDAQARVAVNISFGTLAGPHDGTALLEAAMDQLIALRGGRLQIAVAAGNSYQLRTHANLALAPGASRTLHWQVQPYDRSQSFLELWIEEGRDGIAIELTPPGGTALPALRIGHSGVWRDGGQQAVAALIYPRSVATGDRGTCALVALAPTFSFEPAIATAPCGAWQVRLTNHGAQPAVVDAYIERDDVVVGARGGARQSHFEDSPALPPGQQYDLQAHVDEAARSTPIRRSGNFNSIATGANTVSVGATVLLEPGAWARYSPRSPDPDAGRVQRPGVRTVPAAAAGTDESRAAAGVCAAGSRSAGTVRLAGTSAGAPQVLRARFNAM